MSSVALIFMAWKREEDDITIRAPGHVKNHLDVFVRAAKMRQIQVQAFTLSSSSD